MNEVKDICDRLVADPPPVRDGAEVLRTARRAAVRRDRVALGSGLAAVGVAAATAVALLPGLPAPPGPPVAQTAAGDAATTAPPGPRPVSADQAPPARAAGVHDRKMYRAIRAALPAGYGVRPEFPFSDSTTVYPEPGHPVGAGRILIAATTSVVLSADGREGELSAHVTHDGRPVPTGDLCGSAVTDRLRDAKRRSCEVITMNGVPIRVVTTWDQHRRQGMTAVRFLRGGMLMVAVGQGRTPYTPETQRPADAPTAGRPAEPADHRPPLAAPAFTATELAALAADPAMLP